jgi:hypothetical protein
MSHQQLATHSYGLDVETPSTTDALRFMEQDASRALSRLALDAAARLLAIPASRLRTRDRQGDVLKARWVASWVLEGQGVKLRRIAQHLQLDRTALQHGLKRVRETPELLTIAVAVSSAIASAGTTDSASAAALELVAAMRASMAPGEQVK